MPSPGEKILAAEMMAALGAHVVVVFRQEGLSAGLPWSSKPGMKPEQVLGVVMLYAGLALVAMFGPQPARLAAGVGGLVLLVIIAKTATTLFQGAGVSAKVFQPTASPALPGGAPANPVVVA